MYFYFKKYFSFILLFFLYLSIIFGFFIGEDLNGGARHDYFYAYKPIIEKFSNNFLDTFFKYDQYGQRHSPILIIFLSFFSKIFENDTLLRFIHLHLSLFLIIFFFYSLRLKFKFLNNTQEKELEKLKEHTTSNIVPSLTKRLEMMIKSVDGNREPMAIYQFIQNLPIKDSQDFRKFVNQNKPGLDLIVEVTAPSGEIVPVIVDFGVEFFRPFYGI